MSLHVVIFLHTIQLINDLVDYRICYLSFGLKTDYKWEKNMIFCLLRMILNELDWELLFRSTRSYKDTVI